MRLHVPTRVRWSDLDAYGHVNNTDMFRLLEEARIDAFWAGEAHTGADRGAAILDAGPGADTLSFIAHQEIEYLEPIRYRRDPLDVQMWLGRMGGASLDVCYEVRESRAVDAGLYARAATTLVLVDADTRRPRRIRDEERAVWERYVEEPVRFARRH